MLLGITATAPALLVPASDPLYSDVVLLLRSDDATNGQITFTDESIPARTLTRNGDTIYNNAQTLFGNAASILFDGSGNDWVAIPDNTDLGFEDRTVEFCMEAWIYPVDDGSGNFAILDGRDSSSSEEYSWYVNGAATGIQFVLWNPNVVIGAGAVITPSTWQHVAVTRTLNGSDGDLEMFVNGISVATLAQTNNTATNSGIYHVGHNGFNNTRDWNGHIDSVRVTRNNPRYTGNFTPQSFPAS